MEVNNLLFMKQKKIVADKINSKGDRELLIRWRDYSQKNDQWIEESKIKDYQMIYDYDQKKANINVLQIQTQNNPKIENKIGSGVYHTKMQKSNTLQILKNIFKLSKDLSMWWTILIMMLWVYAPTNATRLFNAYNCSQQQQAEVYQLNDYKECLAPDHQTLSDTLSFNATVLKPSRTTTKFIVWNCKAYYAEYICRESVWWQKREKTKIKPITLTETNCRKTMVELYTHPKKFQKLAENKYRLRTSDRYKCEYDDTRTVDFKHETINGYEAYVQGNSQKLHTSLTNAKCFHNAKACRLEDSSILVWNLTQHRFKKYKVIGNFSMHSLGDWYIIPKLKAGGVVQSKSVDGNRILLEGGLLIIKESANATTDKSFMKSVNQYFKGYGGNPHQSLAGAHLTSIFSLIEGHLDLLHKKLCREKVQLARVETWIIRTFPHTSSILVTDQKEEIIKPLGDAILKLKCKSITIKEVDINWQRNLNGTCYKQMPLINNRTKQYFLELPMHRVIKRGQQIPCEDVGITFIRDTNETLNIVYKNGTLKSYVAKRDTRNHVQFLRDVKGFSELLIPEKKRSCTH